MTARLEICHLHKRYGETVALRDMDFHVDAGEMFGFVGGNGAGKTTTMRIALGVLEADEGEVRWKEQPVDLSIWRRIGYMPEERGLYPRMRVGEQLSYLAELHGLSHSDAEEASQRWLDRLGVAERANDELQSLSLGNQQRVQLAAALVHEPEVLVLDEPFSGLDPLAVEVMSDVLHVQCDRGVAVLFSSHQLDLVERICDRVGVVHDGRMIACGTVEQLRTTPTRRLLVEARAPVGWADAIPGVLSTEATASGTKIELNAAADEQVVLKQALRHGPVQHFGFQRASLSELFRDVVDSQKRDGKGSSRIS